MTVSFSPTILISCGGLLALTDNVSQTCSLLLQTALSKLTNLVLFLMIIKRNSQMSSLRTKIRWSQISWRKDQRVDRVGWLRIPRKVDCRIIITLELPCTLMASLHISETDKGTITLTLVLPVLAHASKVLMVMSHRNNFWAAVRARLPACRCLADRWGHQLLYLCQLLYHCTFFSSYITAGTIVHQLLYHCTFSERTSFAW